MITFDLWVDELRIALGVEDEVDVDQILDLARDAAHDVERRAAPVTTFLVGLAVGRAEATGQADDAFATASALLESRARG